MVTKADLFPDVELWATTYLRAALGARTEPYTAQVKVSNGVPAVMPGRLVTVRRDGGGQLDPFRDNPRLGVNVYAGTEQDVADLAAMVSALLRSAADGKPVLRVRTVSGPSPIADEAGKPRRYLTFELAVRGTQLS